MFIHPFEILHVQIVIQNILGGSFLWKWSKMLALAGKIFSKTLA